MAKRLIKIVHVGGEVYGPGVDVPDDVADKITNPKVWAADEPAEKPARRAASK